MASLLDDVHYALRMWRRHPGFVATAVLALALGIGANTMFSVVSATVLRQLRFSDADRLMTIWQGRTDNPENLNVISWPNLQNVQARVRSLVRLAVFDSAGVGANLGTTANPSRYRDNG